MNDEPPKRGGMPGLMLAHVVCCGGVLLFVTGVLTLRWLSEGGLAWLAAGAAAVAVGFWAWRRLASARVVNADPRQLNQGGHRSPTIARNSDGLE